MHKLNQVQDPEQKLWDSYHELILGPDIGRLRKMLVRFELYNLTRSVEGDIFECGVFKGAGLMYWLKLLAIYEPKSSKKVVGFDTFQFFKTELTPQEKRAVDEYLRESNAEAIEPQAIYEYAQAAGLRDRVDLIKGDVAKTAASYAQENPRARISLLHLDLDTYVGTKAALEAFYPKVNSGGIIVLDEYGDPKWGETQAVNEYFKWKKVKIEKIPHSMKPSAFILKKGR